MTRPSLSATTAPTGTSFKPAARRACRRAAAMPARSPLLARSSGTRGLRRCRGDALEREGIAVFRAIHADPVALDELALEDRERKRILQQPLDRALQRPGPIHGVVALRDEQLLRRGRHFQGQLP